MKKSLILITALCLSSTVYADDLLWKGSPTHRMKSNGTIETTQDYGNYEMRTTNGKHEMIFKNTFQDDSEHIRQQKRERDQQDEINRLKKQLKNQQEQEESDKRKHLINTNLPHNRFNPLLQ